MVTLEEMSDKDMTLLTYPKTHKFHQQFYKDQKRHASGDWYKFTTEDMQYIESKGYKPHRVNAPEGSLILWDSRTFHCNTQAQRDRPKSKFRYVVYVCMTPRKLITKSHLKKKQKAFNELRMTNHWPHQIKLFAKMPRTYGQTFPDYKLQTALPQLNKRGEQLAGLIGY
jgi:hypothetical protein